MWFQFVRNYWKSVKTIHWSNSYVKVKNWYILGDEFKKVIEEVVNKETYEQRKTLAGYALKKNAGQHIAFVKEDVIQAHFKFLAACPAPVF